MRHEQLHVLLLDVADASKMTQRHLLPKLYKKIDDTSGSLLHFMPDSPKAGTASKNQFYEYQFATARPGKNGPKFKKVISSLDMLLFEFLTRKK